MILKIENYKDIILIFDPNFVNRLDRIMTHVVVLPGKADTAN